MQTIVIVKNGEIKNRVPAVIGRDGAVRVGGTMVITNGDKCKEMGLDPKNVARTGKPEECICRMGDNGYGVVIYAESDPEFRALQAKIYDDQKAAEDAKLNAVIPGASKAVELHAAVINDLDRHARQFNRMMADENNDGARPPAPVDKSLQAQLDEHLATHPLAAIYLKAVQRNAKAAIKVLLAGGTPEQASAVQEEADMEMLRSID